MKPLDKPYQGGYYGYALRDLLTDQPPRTLQHRDRMKRAWWLVLIVTIIAAVSFAVVINL